MKVCSFIHVYSRHFCLWSSVVTICERPSEVKWSEVKWSRSVVSDSLRPHRLQPARLLCPWDFPGNSTGVDCHFLLQGIFPTQGSNPVSHIVERCFTVWATREILRMSRWRPKKWCSEMLPLNVQKPGKYHEQGASEANETKDKGKVSLKR